jgi:hypothetical protein
MTMFDAEYCEICNWQPPGPVHDVMIACTCHYPRRFQNLEREIYETVKRIENGTYNQIGDRKLPVKGWTIYD